MPPTKKNSSLKTTTKKKKTKEVPVSKPEVVPEVVEVPSPKSEQKTEQFDYSVEFSTISQSLKDAMLIIKGLTSEVSKLQKQILKDKKISDRELKKKTKNKKTDRAVNGFSKPGEVSDELRKFFGLASDEKIARTEVTKKITAYCQKNNLQNEKDKRIIKPDKGLKKLLRLSDKDELTYFNLQKYMKIHFPNKEGKFVNL